MLFANLWAQHGRDHSETIPPKRILKTSRKENAQTVMSFERTSNPPNESSFMSGEKIGISNATNSLERRIPVELSPKLERKFGSRSEIKDKEEKIVKIDCRSSPFKEDSVTGRKEVIFKIDTNSINSTKTEKPNNSLSSKYKIEDDESTFFSHRSLFPRKLLQRSRFLKRGDPFIDDHHNKSDSPLSRLSQSENVSSHTFNKSEVREHFFDSLNDRGRQNSIFYDTPEEEKSKISFDRQDSRKLSRRPRLTRLFSRFRSGGKVENFET